MAGSIQSALAEWLAHPVVEIRLSDSHEVEELRQQVQRLSDETMQARYLYSQEVSRCLRYEDYFRALGIDFRAIK